MKRFVAILFATSASASVPVPQCDAPLPRAFSLSKIDAGAFWYCYPRLEPSLRLTKATDAAKAHAWERCAATHMRRTGQ